MENSTQKIQAWLTPIRLLMVVICTFALVATFLTTGKDRPLINQFFHWGLVYGGGFISYWLLQKFELAKPTRWEHREITAAILFLIMDPYSPWWVFLAVGVITEVVQRFARMKTGPIMNPAAAGALALAIAGFLPDWWGASFAPRFELAGALISVPVFILVLFLIYIANKYRKLWISGTAILGFAVTYFFLFKFSPWSILADGTLLFFFFLMVPEPKTSPVLQQQQLVYGGAIGVLAAVLLKAGFLEPYLGALIAGNLGYAIWRTWMKPKPRPLTPVAPVPTV